MHVNAGWAQYILWLKAAMAEHMVRVKVAWAGRSTPNGLVACYGQGRLGRHMQRVKAFFTRHVLWVQVGWAYHMLRVNTDLA